MARPRYQALGPLMSGEGSRAFLGLDLQGPEPQPVVLVWVDDRIVADPELFSRARKETEHATSLEHPNILRVHGIATLDEGIARAVEYGDGEPLRYVLNAVKHLPVPIAARVVADAAMGVHYAHLAGNDDGSPMVHGDLRPETMLLCFSGHCKVTGYGGLSVAPKETGGQRVLGRRTHVSPEQIIGGREAVAEQTDVYLLGITLYECLTGKVPFVDDSDFDLAVLSKALPPIDAPGVTDPLRKVIRVATAKRAGERFPTALAFKEALEEAAGPLPAHEEVAAYLANAWPEASEKRAARQREIDAGIAEAKATAPPPPAQTAPPAPAKVEAPRPIPLPPPAAPVARTIERPTYDEEEPSAPYRPPRRPKWLPAALIAAALVALVIWGLYRPSSAPAPVASAPVDAGVVLAAGKTAAPEPAEPEEPDLLTALPPKPVFQPFLELKVEPPVELTIDGQPVGRAPFSGPLSAGRHTIGLVDKSLGISTTRVVTVSATKKTEHAIYLSKGFVSVSAPDGAIITINGTRIGKAPLSKDVELYEGRHHLVVTVGKAKWQQRFNLAAGERAYWNVETE